MHIAFFVGRSEVRQVSRFFCCSGKLLRPKACLFAFLFCLLFSLVGNAQRTVVLTQNETDATLGGDRKGFGGPYSQAYHHDYNLGARLSACESIVSVELEIDIATYTENIPAGCSRGPTYYNIYYGCASYDGTGGSCPETNNIDAPNSNNHTADYNRTYTTAVHNFDFGGNFSVDVAPVFDTGCNGGDGANAISLGFVAYTYTITVTIEIENSADPDAIPDHSDVCPGDGPIELIGSTTATGTNITYNWTGPNNFMATGGPAVLTRNPADEGIYTLVVDVDGCTSAPETIDVNYLPGITSQLSAVNNMVCLGENIELEITGGGTGFAWTDPEGNSVGGNSATLTTPAAGAPGIQTYSVTVSNGSCSEVRDIEINVSDQIAGAIIPNPLGGICAGEPISFTAVRADGSDYPSDWTFNWDNGASNDPIYEITQNTPGNYTVELTVDNPAGCGSILAEPYIVSSSPTVTISPVASTICADGSIELTANASGGSGNYEYLWGPAEDETSSTITIDVNSPDSINLYVVVTDVNSGCTAISNFADVAILPALDQVTFGACPTGSATEITFSWNDVGQDAFELYLTEGAGPEQTISTNFTGLSYTAPGLTPGSSATLRVVPVISDNGVTCTGESASLTCSTTMSCSNPGWLFTAIDPVCLTTDGQAFDLTINTAAAGTVVLNSTDLNLTNQPNGPGGITTVSLPALTGTTTSDVYTVMARFTLADGSCPFDTTFNIPVVTPANPEISTPFSRVCSTLATVTFNLVNNYDPNSTYVISVDNPSGSTITMEDAPGQNFQISFTEHRTYQITLTTTTVGNSGCSDSFTLPFTLNEPLMEPTLSCVGTGLDSVAFSWSDVGADSYTVDQISIPGNGVPEQTNNGFIVRGLTAGDTVTIAVTASTAGCTSVISDTITCVAMSCPSLALSIDQVGPICVGADDDIQLTTSVVGSSNGTGVVTFADSTYINGDNFSPAGLASGFYTVSAIFVEDGCSFPASIDVEITDLPDPSFTLPTGPVCINEVVGADAGAEMVGWSYVFTADATASIVETGITTRDISWSTPGTKEVTLMVMDANGCENQSVETIEVFAPLSAPVIGCGISSATSVEFSWNMDVGVDSFLVTIDGGGAAFFQDSANLSITGLNAGEIVNIQVIAFSSGPCGNSPVAMGSCEAGSCPTITVTPPANQSFCLGAMSNRLLLFATQTGAAGTGTFSFSGAGVIETAGIYLFDANAAGPGVHPITTSYDESGCSAMATFEFTVGAAPSSDFTLNGLANNLRVCEGEVFTFAYSGDLPQSDNGIFTSSFAPASRGADLGYESYELSYADTGDYVISLSVIGNGCESDTTRLNVSVEAPLPAPVVICTGASLNSVTFIWDAVPGAEGYVISDGTNLSAAELSHTVSGLMPGETTMITVTALSSASCGDSPASVSTSCSADDCPTLSLDVSGLQNDVCLLNGDETIDLSTVVVTGGSGIAAAYVFTSPVVSGTVFDAAAAGGSEAGITHTINVEYTEEGPCSFNGSFEVTVFERPTVFITEVDPQCVGDTVVVLIGSTNFVNNDDISVEWDGGVVLDDGNSNDNSYAVSWGTPGMKDVTASVTSNISGCESLPVSRTVIVEAPLETPVVSCTDQQLESMTFSWDEIPGATGYQIILNNAVTEMVGTNSYTVDNLSPETFFGISVTALGNAPCGNSPAATAICETLPCPGGSVEAISPSRDICLDGNEMPILLEAALDTGTPSGPFEWSGTGIVDLGNGSYTFDPAGLPAGNYPLLVTYRGQANCTSTDQIAINLFDLPPADFSATETLLCAGGETLISINGPAIFGATYDWVFPQGSPATATGPLQNLPLSWTEAGTYTIQLSLTSNGCTETLSQEITVSSPGNPGVAIGDDLQRCAGNMETIDLNTLITGQDQGGSWAFTPDGNPTNTNLSLATGVFDAVALPPGDYRFAYTIDGTTCPATSTEIGLSLLAAPLADAGPEQRLTCTMGMVSLNGTGSDEGQGFTYRWFSDDPAIIIMGADQPMIDVGQPGVYQLEVTNAIGCSSVSEVVVTAETEAPVVEIELSQITCFQSDDGAIQVTNVNGGRAPYTFTLNGADRGQSTIFAGLEPREYDLMVTDANGCFSNVLLDLREPEELTIRLRFPGDDPETTFGEEILISAVVNGSNAIDTLIWQPDSLRTNDGVLDGIEFIATETQMISVTVVDELGCTATDQEMLLVRKDRPVYFPTAFSPNGDNVNDIFLINGDIDKIDFIENFFIFNRWGEAVYNGGQLANSGGTTNRFQPNDPDFGWDGRLNGVVLNPQTLVYSATIHFTDGEVIVYRGDFVLLR